jgi:hypothetical protein
MAENINLNRNVFDKNAFKNTVDTNFTQLVSTPDPTFFDVNLATIEDFFILYNKFFYEIPQFGEINSHEYLIKTSTEYIGFQQTNEDIQALLDEITSLRQEILDIQLASIQDIDQANEASTNVSNDLTTLRQNLANRSIQNQIASR